MARQRFQRPRPARATAAPVAAPPFLNWAAENQALLESELCRLRLLLRRRVLWLRHRWQHDPLQEYQALVVSDAQADSLLAGEDREAESRFYREDEEAVRLGRSITALEQELAGRVRRMTEAGAPPAMTALEHFFGLSRFDREVLLLCLAPELDPAFERLYAYAQDDMGRRHATPHLALGLFGGMAPEAGPSTAAPDGWSRLLAEAPLRRFRLVTLDPAPAPGAGVGRALRLDERIGAYLQGINRPDERAAGLLRPVLPAPLAPVHRDLAGRLARWLRSLPRDRPWPLLNLVGPPGAGKQALAQAVCERLGLQLSRLDAARVPAPGCEREEMLRLLEREAVLLQLALYLDPAQVEGTEPPAGDLTERLAGCLFAASRERLRTERGTVRIDVPGLDGSGRRALWEQALADQHLSVDGQLDAFVEQFGFGPQEVTGTVAAARARAGLRGEDGDAVTPEDLWQACRDQAGWQMADLAQRILPGYAWEDIVVPGDVLQQLEEIAAQVAHRARVYEEWGYGARLSRGRGISALFSGPSGTGKTMAAEVLAAHLRLDLYRIDLAGVVSKYIGETEKNLRRVFDAAEQSGAVLFFDEADALFGKRTEVKDSHDRYANIEIDYLLQRMEEYRGLAVLATNRKGALDRAFLRRLRFLVEFPFPDLEHRRRIWQQVFPPEVPVEDLDLEFLAQMELPGGNIRSVALNAAFLAAAAGSAVRMPHLLHAARREYAKIERLVPEGVWEGPARRVRR